MNQNQPQQNKQKLEQFAVREGFPVEKAEQFLVFFQGNDTPFVTTAGLDWLMEQKFDKGYTVRAIPPTLDELAALQAMYPTPCTIMRGEVWPNGYERPFVDYGTTSDINLRGFVKYNAYGIEMACRRATNRAKRLASGCGLTSADEIDKAQAEERAAPPGQTNQSHRPSGKDDAFKVFLDVCGKAKKLVGDEVYYQILGGEGFEKSNQVPPGDTDVQGRILATLREAFKEAQKGKGELPFDGVDKGNPTKGPVDKIKPTTRARLLLAIKTAQMDENTACVWISEHVRQPIASKIEEAVDGCTDAQARDMITELGKDIREEESLPNE